MKTLLLLAFVLIAAGLTGASPPPAFANSKHFVLPFQVTNGTSTAEILSVDSGLVDPKMIPDVNDSTFDCDSDSVPLLNDTVCAGWHFDVVGRSRSLNVVFYNFGGSSLDVPYPGGPLLVQVSGTFENGTSFLKSAAATEGATFDSLGPRGISSAWYGKNDSVYYFAGGPFNKPEIPLTLGFYGNDIEIYGAVWLTPRSPPRYPCNLDTPGVTQEVMPGIYWSNAVPYDNASVELKIDGDVFAFDGSGYHDKTWGGNHLKDSVRTRYRGHGHIHNYTLVWSSALDQEGKEHLSSWIGHVNGEAVFQSCQIQSVVVRPWGENSAYPPTPGLPAPSGYHIRYDLGGGRAFVVNFTTQTVERSTDTYKSVAGFVLGGFEGEEQHNGAALCEQFQH